MVTSISHRALRIVLLSMLAVSVGLANRTSLASGMRDHADSLAAVPEDASLYVAWLKNRTIRVDQRNQRLEEANLHPGAANGVDAGRDPVAVSHRPAAYRV